MRNSLITKRKSMTTRINSRIKIRKNYRKNKCSYLRWPELKVMLNTNKRSFNNRFNYQSLNPLDKIANSKAKTQTQKRISWKKVHKVKNHKSIRWRIFWACRKIQATKSMKKQIIPRNFDFDKVNSNINNIFFYTF